jgi:hypothetical protein
VALPLFCTPPIVIVIVVQRLAEAPGKIDQQCGNPLHIRIVQRAYETNRSESPLRLTIFIIGCNERIADAPHQSDGIRIENARCQQRAKLFGGDKRTDLLHQFSKLRDDGDQRQDIIIDEIVAWRRTEEVWLIVVTTRTKYKLMVLHRLGEIYSSSHKG